MHLILNLLIKKYNCFSGGVVLKINIIIPSINLSGGIRVIFLYANYLVSQGHDVICYFPLKLFNLSKLIIIKRSIKTFLKGPKKSIG